MLLRADSAAAWVNPERVGGAPAPSLTKSFQKTPLLRVTGLWLAWQLLGDVPPPAGTHSTGTVSDLHSGCDPVLPCHHRMSSESEMPVGPVCQGACWLLRDAEAAANTLAAVFTGCCAAVMVNWPARALLLRLPEALLTLLSLGLSSSPLNLCGHLLCLILKHGSAPELSHTLPGLSSLLVSVIGCTPATPNLRPGPVLISCLRLTPPIPSNPSTVPATEQVVAHL